MWNPTMFQVTVSPSTTVMSVGRKELISRNSGNMKSPAWAVYVVAAETYLVVANVAPMARTRASVAAATTVLLTFLLMLTRLLP